MRRYTGAGSVGWTGSPNHVLTILKRIPRVWTEWLDLDFPWCRTADFREICFWIAMLIRLSVVPHIKRGETQLSRSEYFRLVEGTHMAVSVRPGPASARRRWWRGGNLLPRCPETASAIIVLGRNCHRCSRMGIALLVNTSISVGLRALRI